MADEPDIYEFEEDLPTSVLWQIEQLDLQEDSRASREQQRKRDMLLVRRNIEDWRERRNMRDQIDYLD
jgi:hypothetical protein